MLRMFAKALIFILLSPGLVACGNRGDLYLSDESRIKKSRDAQEIARLHKRVQKYHKLERDTLRLQAEIQKLRRLGQHKKANAKYIEYKELRHKMGQMTIERQQESKYGNI